MELSNSELEEAIVAGNECICRAKFELLARLIMDWSILKLENEIEFIDEIGDICWDKIPRYQASSVKSARNYFSTVILCRLRGAYRTEKSIKFRKLRARST